MKVSLPGGEIIPAVAIKRRRPGELAFASSHPQPPLHQRLGRRRRRTRRRRRRITCCPERRIWQWQPWRGGRLRGCLYFGAQLQPQGGRSPHGSQISKSIAPPALSLSKRCSAQSAEKCNTWEFGSRGGDLQRALIEADSQPTIFNLRRVWKFENVELFISCNVRVLWTFLHRMCYSSLTV